jgi:uncharacterized protein (DUF362 family)
MVPNPKTVKIYRVKEDISDIIKEAVETSGLRGKGTIFIKPNLSHPEYLPGVVTSPELMQELVGLLRDDNSDVVVGESNGFNYPCWTAFDKTGMQAAVETAGGSQVSRQHAPKTAFSAQNHPRRRRRGGFAAHENA